MGSDQDSPAEPNRGGGLAETTSRGLAWVAQAITAASRLGASVAGWLFLGLALYIVSDIITRRFGFSTKVTDEISGYVLAAGTAWSMAYAFDRKEHVRVDVILLKLPKRVQGVLNVIALAIVAIVMAGVVRSMWGLVSESFKYDTRSNTTLHFPVAWPQLVWALGYTAFLGLTVVLLIRGLGSLARGRAAELAVSLGPRSFDKHDASSID